MKKMFLSSSFADVANLFEKFVDEELSGKKVTFIPTASLTEEVTFYVGAGKEALERMGLIVDELEVSTSTIDEIENKLKNNDFIYISGGNTFFLLQELLRTGADKLIIEQVNQGKIYIGESAGSIILSQNIEYIKDMDDCEAAPTLGTCTSLGLVDFCTVPHYKNFPFEESVERIITEYEDKLNLCPISNNQAIIVRDCRYEVWSNEAS